MVDFLKRNTNLFLKRHHQDAPHLEQVLHVILVVLLHPGPTVHPVILTALWRNLQAVAHNKGWLTELESEETHRSNENLLYTCGELENITDALGYLLIKAVAGFDEGVELLVGVLNNICV